MSCSNFFKGIFFFIFTLVVLGSITLVSFIFSKTFNQMKLNALYTYSLIAMVVSGSLLIISIIAVFLNSKCFRSFISLIYLLFDFVILAIGIFFLTSKDQVVKISYKLWQDVNTSDPNFTIPEATKQFQINFECCGLYGNETSFNCTAGVTVGCQSKINDWADNKLRLTGLLLVGVFFVFLIIIVLSFKMSCNSGDYEDVNSKEQYNTPLTYGW